jgi:hypothetical protein
MIDSVTAAWHWLKCNDIPNWITLLFTVIALPIALLLWHRRKVNSVFGLEVHLSASEMMIGSKPFKAVNIGFTNHTGSVAYINGARIRSITDAFPVPVEAARDIAQGSYHLKFPQPNGILDLREITLQTNLSVNTLMPASPELPKEFFTYKPSWLARRFRLQKYFVLEYTAMVGTTRHAVATLY